MVTEKVITTAYSHWSSHADRHIPPIFTT